MRVKGARVLAGFGAAPQGFDFALSNFILNLEVKKWQIYQAAKCRREY